MQKVVGNYRLFCAGFVDILSEKEIPLDKVLVMFQRQSAVRSEIIFKMAEERFKGIGISGLHVDGFLPNELPVLLVPLVKLPEPEYPVVVCPDTVYLPYEPPEGDASRSPGVLRQP